MDKSLLTTEYMRKIVEQDAELMKLVPKDKIFGMIAHSGTQYPFIVYSRSALNPQYNKDNGLANGLGHKNTVQITVDCYSDKYVESLEVANAFRHALEGKGWKDKDIYIDYFELVSAGENTDGESYFMQTLVFQTEAK